MKRGTYIEPRQVAHALDYRHPCACGDPECGNGALNARRARRWLQRWDAAIKVGGRWKTTRYLLRRVFPEVWDDIASQGEE